MKLEESSVESLNYALDDLSIENTSRFNLSDFESSAILGERELEYYGTCSALIKSLSYYFPEIPAGDVDSIDDVYAVLGNHGPSFTSDVEFIRFRLLQFLVSSIQSERLFVHASKKSQRNTVAGERGKLAFELEKLCRYIGFDIESVMESDDIAVTQEIEKHLEGKLASIDRETFENTAKILSPQTLSIEQQETMKQIEVHLFEDFTIRRKMLVKRLDVTIQSFLWGEQVQGKESEIVAAIQAQRKRLQVEPNNYSYEDAEMAPLSLLHEHTQKVTNHLASSQQSFLKTLIIGSVPDRGGRANEMRPKPSDMNPFSNNNNRNHSQSRSNKDSSRKPFHSDNQSKRRKDGKNSR